tara:strand:+ start:2199 stop:2648 length:450 start_codon:yes stop_codon:yes gene_type:complete
MKKSELRNLIRKITFEVLNEQKMQPQGGNNPTGTGIEWPPKESDKPVRERLKKPMKPTKGMNRRGDGGGIKAPMKGDRPNLNDFGCGTNPNGPGCPGYNSNNCCQQVFGQSPMQIIFPGTPMYGDMPCYNIQGQYIGDVTANEPCGQTN